MRVKISKSNICPNVLEMIYFHIIKLLKGSKILTAFLLLAVEVSPYTNFGRSIELKVLKSIEST